MKRIVKLGMVCMVLLVTCLGCGTNKKEVNISTENVNELTDDNSSAQDAFQGIARVEKGFYFIDNSCLCFYDEGLGKATILCTDAGCEHKSEECNAYLFGFEQECLYGYENELYGIETDYEAETDLMHYYLTKISRDGTTRTKLVDLFQNPNGQEVSFVIIQHRGYCYFAINENSYDEKKEGTVYRAKLEKGAKVETVYQDSGYGINYSIHGYGDSIYIGEDKYEDAAQQKRVSQIWQYSLEDEKIFKVIEEPFRVFTFAEGTLFYTTNDAIWKFDGKKSEKFYELGQDMFGNLWYDGTYLCFDTLTDCFVKEKDESERKIYVIDKEGTLINSPTVSESCLYLTKVKDTCIWQNLWGQKYLSGDTETKEQTWKVDEIEIEGMKEE